jgi:hypothetical protein
MFNTLPFHSKNRYANVPTVGMLRSTLPGMLNEKLGLYKLTTGLSMGNEGRIFYATIMWP